MIGIYGIFPIYIGRENEVRTSRIESKAAWSAA
jgi:hypothetical protein